MPTAPTFAELYRLFAHGAELPSVVEIAASELPHAYRSLLDHTNHMTVTVEAYYGQPVDVRVLDSTLVGSKYSRHIVLQLPGDGRVVQFGIVRIDLRVLPESVRKEILAANTPLGRVLVRNRVLTRVQLSGFVRVRTDEQFAGILNVAHGVETYGRLGVIYVDDAPAIEMLEVLTPLRFDENADSR